MRKIILFSLCYFFFVNIVLSQSFTVFEANGKKFPVVSCKFRATDKNGLPLYNFSISDFKITESGIDRPVLSVTCQPPTKDVPLSSVLCLDVSGSMSGTPLQTISQMADAWIDMLMTTESDCAITSFNSESYLNTDFINNKDTLKNILKSFTSSDGTSFDAAFTTPQIGAVDVAKYGKNSRIIILLSDGGSTITKDQQIINACKQYGIRVFCFIIGYKHPQLQTICDETGGKIFYITKVSEAKDMFAELVGEAKGNDPCELTWLSMENCDLDHRTKITLKTSNLTDSIDIPTPDGKLSFISTTPEFMDFGSITPNTKSTQEIVLKANNDTITVQKIALDNSIFTIKSFGGAPPPFKMLPGQTRKLGIEFAPVDSSFSFGRLTIESDACINYYDAACFGGFRNSSNNKLLKITKPNGGEVYIAGNDSLVKWEGISPNEKVRLEFSIDSGKTWNIITDTANNLKYLWNVENTPSKKCLMRVSQFKNPNRKEIVFSGMLDISCLSWSPDDKYIAMGNLDNSLRIIEVATGKLVKVIKDLSLGDQVLWSVSWSPDGKKIAFAGMQNYIFFCDPSTGNIIKRIKTPNINSETREISWSSDSKYIAALNPWLNIWEYDSGKLLRTYDSVSKFCWVKDRNKIALQKEYDKIISLVTVPDMSLYYAKSYETDAQLYQGKDSTRIFYIKSGSSFTFNELNADNLQLVKKTSKTITNAINYTLFHNNGKPVFVYKNVIDNSFYFIDLEADKLIDTIKRFPEVTIFAPSHNSKNFAFISYKSSLFNHEFLTTNTKLVFLDFSNGTNLGNLSWSGDGSHIMSNTNFLIFDKNNDTTIQSLDRLINHDLKYAFYSEDGTKIIAINKGDSILHVDPQKFTVRTSFKIKNFFFSTPNNVVFSRDGYWAAQFNYNTIYLFNLLTNTQYTLNASSYYMKSMDISPDNNKLAVAMADTIFLWLFKYNKPILKIIQKGTDIKWSPDGSYLAVNLLSPKGIAIYDASSGKEKCRIFGSSYTYLINSINWLPDSKRILFCEDNNRTLLWNIDSLKPKLLYNGYSNYARANFEADYVAHYGTGSRPNSWAFKVTPLDEILQTDVSDSLWSIIAPSISLFDVDMGKVGLGDTRDSIVYGFIKNTGSVTVKIDSLGLSGADASEFVILTRVSNCTLKPGDDFPVEFRFKPTSTGNKSARIIIFNKFNKNLYATITGQCVNERFAITQNNIDFGEVYILGFKDSLACVLKNTGNQLLSIDTAFLTGPDLKQFIMRDVFTKQVLKPGESVSLRLRFAPTSLGRSYCEMQFNIKEFKIPVKVYLFGEAVTPCTKIYIDYPQFRQDSGLKFVGSAFLNDSMIRLTRNESLDIGAFWFKDYVPVAEGFITKFKFRMSQGNDFNSKDGSLPGADGIAFLIQNESLKAMGISGGGMGYTGISNSIAIEFDTYANDSTQIENFHDPNGNHVAINTCGLANNSSAHSSTNTLAMNRYMDTINTNGKIYYAKIEYSAKKKTLKLWLDSIPAFVKPILVKDNIDLNSILNLTDRKYAYVGFTAATGKSVENHDILSWSFCQEDSVYSDVEDNYNQTQEQRVFPNPAIKTFNIQYSVPYQSHVEISIYNAVGEKIEELVNEIQTAGEYRLLRDEISLPNGLYFIKFNIGGISRMEKLVIMK